MTLKEIKNARNELDIMMNLDNPNVMKYGDYYENMSSIYIVMDLMINNFRNIMVLNRGPLSER